MVIKTPLLAAPHRLHFFIGLTQFAALMAWWSWFQGLLATDNPLPPHHIPLNLLHGPAMIFLALTPLFCGFLLTVFPRWAGLPDLTPSIYLPPAIAFTLAIITWWIGIGSGAATVVISAFALAAAAMLLAGFAMVRVHLEERRLDKPVTWHARSVLLAWLFGATAFGLLLGALVRPDYNLLLIANRIAVHLFVLPVFVTVAHRMIPFFAGNVVEGYQRWRPMWVLALFWAGSLTLMVGDLREAIWLQGVGAVLCMTATLLTLFRWWPRSSAPGLLWVLVIAFTWAPIGYALTTLKVAGFALYRAPDHALLIGFAGGLIVAMVTRVTQGHSGRPLEMPALAWIAFTGVQLAALLRVAAGMFDEDNRWLFTSAVLLLVSLTTWTGRNLIIYLSPRKDGKSG